MDVQKNLPDGLRISVLQDEEAVTLQQVEPQCQTQFITQPDANYLSSTTKIDISGIPEFTNVNSISDGIQTVTFSTPMERRQVPNSWPDWNSPPNVEDSTPPVLVNQGGTPLTMNLSFPSRIFGFEFGTELVDSVEYEIEFLSGGVVIAGVGFSGPALESRLFAIDRGNNCCNGVDQVVVESAQPFAIAQIRYTPIGIVDFNCPDDMTVVNDIGLNGAFVHFPDPIVNSTLPAVTTCTPPSGSFFSAGNTTVTCTAVDTCGNTRSCSFNVRVVIDPCRFFGRRCCR